MVDANNTIAAIIVNIERVLNENNAILNTLGFLQGKELSRGFFLVGSFGAAIQEHEEVRHMEVNNALRILEKYSLIRLICSEGGDSEQDIVMVHSLVREAVKC